jgi:6-phosphogluconolactonase
MSNRRAAVEVFDTPDRLMAAAAEAFVECADHALRASGRFVVALSGGSTPAALYGLLATEPIADRVDWPRVHVFWGDERCVPPDDPASNYRMARERLLDHVPVSSPQVHRIHGEDDPTAAAAAYERELRATLATGSLDLVLLGMGNDGHTASLFPSTPAVREPQRWVIAHQVVGAPSAAWRITMTPLVLNRAADVLFLVTGADKAATLPRVLEGPLDPDALPSQSIAPRDGRVRWLVDAAAAAELTP